MFNEAYEATTLGLILSYDHLHEQIIPRLSPYAFFTGKYRVIFECAKQLFDAGNPVNIATVTSEVQKVTSDIPPAEITKLLMADGVNYLDDASHYTSTLIDLQKRRDVIATAQDTSQDINAVTGIIDGVTPDDDFGVSRIYDATHAYLDTLEEREKSGGGLVGLPFKWGKLNTVTSGMEKGQLIFIGGRPGMGKSAVLQNQALYTALQRKQDGKPYHVLFISCEISEFSIVNNLTGIFTGISQQTLKAAKFTPEQRKRMMDGSGTLSKLRFTMKTQGTVTPVTVRNLVKKYRPDLVCIDYLQLMKSENGIYRNDRTSQTAYISNNLKQVAKDFEVPLFVAVQLSRALEARQDKHPILSDLKQSGDIEQDADMVLFIYRDDYYNGDPEIEIEYSPTELILAKNREGQSNRMIPAMMHMKTLRINEIERRALGASG